MKKNFENLKDGKFSSLEAEQLNSIKGGRKSGGITLETLTVTPSGSAPDGQDPEDDGAKA